MRLAEEARIAELARGFDRPAAQANGQGEIVGMLGQGDAQALEIAQRWIALFRQAFEHIAVRSRRVWHRKSRYDGEQRDGEQRSGLQIP